MAQVVQKDCSITDELLERWKYTPDFHVLKLQDYVPVFVYGTLKRGEANHYMLEDCPFLGLGETVTPCFRMRSYAGMFPIMTSETRKEYQKYTDYVLGEVYAVPPVRLLYIDKLESNGNMFQREEKHVWLPDQTFKGSKGPVKPSIKVWMYLGTPYFQNLDELPDVPTTKFNNRRYLEWSSSQEDSMWQMESSDMTIEKLNEKFVEDYQLGNGKIPF